jgi:hypothetical protein
MAGRECTECSVPAAPLSIIQVNIRLSRVNKAYIRRKNNIMRVFIYKHINNFMEQQPLVGQGFLIIETSRSQTPPNTRHSVGLLWTSDKPDAMTSTWQHTTLRRDTTSMPAAGFEPAIPASERPQTHAFDRAATGIGRFTVYRNKTTLQLGIL